MLLPGEFQDLFSEVQKINGFKTLENLTEEAKTNKWGDSEANILYYCLHKFIYIA